MSNTHVPAPGTNLAVVVGVLNRAPEPRRLRSGEEVLGFELRVQPPGRAAESVPVAWHNASSSASSWAIGEELLVLGRVHRRFFRVGAQTQSRTEVRATTAIPTRRAVRSRRALAAAVAALQPQDAPPI